MVSVRTLSLCALFVLACGPSSGSGDDDGADGDGGPDDPCAGGRCENACPNGTRTSLTGRVVAPNGVDPIPFAQVFVPASLAPIPDGVACEVCDDLHANALVRTTTAVDGTFELGPIPTREDQPAGEVIDLVVQKGRFRKVSKVIIEQPCDGNAAAADLTTLPGKTDGLDTIPKIAIATGDYDVMECVLLELGLEQDSFDLYNGVGGGLFGGGTPGAVGELDGLLGDLAAMKQYNIIFLNCADDTYEAELDKPAVKANVEAYVAAGGRLYVTDWSYDYVEQIDGFASVIDFAPGMSGNAPEPRNAAAIGPNGVEIDARIEDDGLASWLAAVEQVTGDEIISDDRTVHVEHFLVGWVMQFAVTASETTKVWLTGEAGSGLAGMRPLTTTFDYQECGRVLYSSYHTTGRGAPSDPFADPYEFPGYCSDEGLSPQERVLLYLILHVADCIGGPVE